MKIERLNDNQFRCTMTMVELLQRHLTVKKLSTSPPDAIRLVRELIERSMDEVGFVPNEFPVMVEAVKNAEGDMVFTVTKINSEDELPPHIQPHPDLMRLFHGLLQAAHFQKEELKTRQPLPLAVFAFPSRELVKVPPRIRDLPPGICSDLYYFKEQEAYYLLIYTTPRYGEEFNRICLLMAEYGHRVPSTTASRQYYAENGQAIYVGDALRQIAESSGESR